MDENLSRSDLAIVAEWMEYAASDSYRYGAAPGMTPDEIRISERVKSASAAGCVFSGRELEVVGEWMNKSIRRRYGSAVYLIGPERELYLRIISAIQECAPSEAIPPIGTLEHNAGCAVSNIIGAGIHRASDVGQARGVLMLHGDICLRLKNLMYVGGALLFMALSIWLITRF